MILCKAHQSAAIRNRRICTTLVHFGLIWLLAVWHLAGHAQPPYPARDLRDQISDRAWLDDPSNDLGPEQVLARTDWTPYSGPLRRGFKTSTTWIRLTVQPLADKGQRSADREARLVLRMLPGQIDEIALFDPRRSGQPPLLAGDLYDWRRGEYRSFNQNLVIDTPDEPVVILLRLRTTSHHGIHVEALRWEDVEDMDRQQQLIIGAVIVFLLMILGWAINAWISRPDPVLLAFVIHQLFSIFFSLAILGFFRVYLSGLLSPHAISHLTSASVPLTASGVLFFHWFLLREFQPPNIAMHGLKWLGILTPFTLVLMLLGHSSLALQIALTVVLITPLVLLILALLARKRRPEEEPRVPRGYLVLAYSLMLLILWNATLPAFGWLPSPPWAMYGAISYGVVSAMILMSLLRARTKHLDTARREAQLQLALTEQTIRYERDMRREQDQFMTMLTHELTNALATAHLAIGSLNPSSPMRARGYRAIDSIRNILQRCALSGELEVVKSLPKIAPVDVRMLLQEACEQTQSAADIVVKADTRPHTCATDRQLLSVVISNLLDNALKYRAPASLVEVTLSYQTRDTKPGVQLSVINEPGEAGHPDPDRVFDKYWRGAGATRSAGSGLGLYLSSQIANRLGANLKYQFETPHVRFVLWLPV